MISTVYLVVVVGCLLAFCSVRFFRMPPSFGSLHIAAVLVLVGSLLIHVFGLKQPDVNSLRLSSLFGAALFQITLPLWLFASVLAGNVYTPRETIRSGFAGVLASAFASVLAVSLLMRAFSGAAHQQELWCICFAFGAVVAIPDPRASSDFVRYSTGEQRTSEIMRFTSSLLATVLLSAFAGLSTVAHSDLAISRLIMWGVITWVGAVTLGSVCGRAAFLLLKLTPTQAFLLTLALAFGVVTLANLAHVPPVLASVAAAMIFRRSVLASNVPEDESLPTPQFWNYLELIWNSAIIVILALVALTIKFPLPSIVLGFGAWLTCTAIRWVSTHVGKGTRRDTTPAEGFIPGLLLLAVSSARLFGSVESWILPASYVFLLFSVFARPRSQRLLSSTAKAGLLSA